MIGTLVVVVLLALLSLLIGAELLLRLLRRCGFVRPRPPRPDGDALAAFFADPANTRDRTIDEIRAGAGTPDHDDDWDLGRLMYEWRRPQLRIRVGCDGCGGPIRTVEFLDPADTSRFGTVSRTILSEPYNFQHSTRRDEGTD